MIFPSTVESSLDLNDKLYYQKIESKLGHLHIITSKSHLKMVSFDSNWKKNRKIKKENIEEKKLEIHSLVETQLTEYFNGKRVKFEVPLDPVGTFFQKSVWKALLSIPYGTTLTYGEQAKAIGNKKAVRAVGLANGKNPIAIIIPCHRVIGKNGTLTGYAGGLSLKKTLINIENSEFIFCD